MCRMQLLQTDPNFKHPRSAQIPIKCMNNENDHILYSNWEQITGMVWIWHRLVVFFKNPLWIIKWYFALAGFKKLFIPFSNSLLMSLLISWGSSTAVIKSTKINFRISTNYKYHLKKNTLLVSQDHLHWYGYWHRHSCMCEGRRIHNYKTWQAYYRQEQPLLNELHSTNARAAQYTG